MDPELLGLTYIKGASTDSGIDTAPCLPAPLLAPLHLAGSRAGVHCRSEQWSEPTDVPGPDDDPAKIYAVHSYASAISTTHTAEGSMGDLSEISSHSRYAFLENEGLWAIDPQTDDSFVLFSFCLPFFETERKRFWWYLLYSDAYMSSFQGIFDESDWKA